MVSEVSVPTAEDADEIASLHLASFNSNPLLHIQYPKSDSLKGLHAYLSQSIVQDLQDPGKAVLVVRDSKTNRIVSFAKWNLPNLYSTEQADIILIDGCKKQFLDEYSEKAAAAKNRVIGDSPCYFLTFIGTHPNFQGCGWGTLLINWGLERAKSENIPVYLDSTVGASNLYRKLGFVALDGLSMTLPGVGKDGGLCIYKEVSMLRTWEDKN